MSLRLNNERTTFPPNGLIFHQRELGWVNTKADATTVWNWEGLITAVQNLRRANQARVPGLSLDRETIRREISEQNARRIAAMPGAETYLTQGPFGGTNPDPTSAAPSSVLSSLPAVAGKLKDLAHGAASLWDWWKNEEGMPVPPEQAERRAEVCTRCPKNNMEGDLAWFTKPAADLIRKKLEAKTQLNLRTIYDDRLGVCEACHCELQLAVHEPLDIKLKHLSGTAKSKLWEKCWVLAEETRLGL